MANPVTHFEVVGKDGTALVGFYEQLFGWKTQVVEGMPYATVEKEGEGIGGGIGTSQDGGTSVTFYVQVDDPQGALDRAVELGGSVTMPVMAIPGIVTIGQFADPEGNVIGVAGNEPPPA